MQQLLLKFWLWSILFLALLFTANVSHAHDGRPLYIQVTEIQSGLFELNWRIPPVLPQHALPSITLSKEHCQPVNKVQKSQLIGKRLYTCTEHELALRPDEVVIHYPISNPVLSTLIRYQWLNGETNSFLNSPNQTRIALPKQINLLHILTSYSKNGIAHILSGIDHLLFVTCLLIIAFAQQERRIKILVVTITGFTLGHSLTLAWISLTNASLSSSLVETLIAFSILIMALEIANNKKNSLTYQHPTAIALLFGLLHGLGFAGYLSEIGLPYNQEIAALVFFNLGVELGQLLFICVLLLIYYISNKALSSLEPVKQRLTFWFSRLVGSLTSYWMIVRFLEL